MKIRSRVASRLATIRVPWAEELTFNPIFTREQLQSYTQFPSADEMPLMQVAEFNPQQFGRRGSGYAAAHSGNKEDCPDALLFWLWSLQHAVQPINDDVRPYVREALCDELSQSEYFLMVDGFSTSLKRAAPDFLVDHVGFRRATRILFQALIEDTLRGAYVAEYDDRFVAYHVWVGV